MVHVRQSDWRWKTCCGSHDLLARSSLVADVHSSMLLPCSPAGRPIEMSGESFPEYLHDTVMRTIKRLSNPELDMIRVRQEAVDQIGFLCAEHGAALLATHVPQLLALLRPDVEYRTRMLALEALAKIEATLLAEHLPSILPLIDKDECPMVRELALRCLAASPPERGPSLQSCTGRSSMGLRSSLPRIGCSVYRRGVRLQYFEIVFVDILRG